MQRLLSACAVHGAYLDHLILMATCTKVIDSFTILENILIQLPTEDILLAQRVNKAFKATVELSINLQQALFLAPKPASQHGEPTIAELNPLLPWPQGRNIDDIRLTPLYFLTSLNRLVLPPLEERDVIGGDPRQLVLRVHAEHEVNIKPSYRRSNARMELSDVSWRKMLVTNPPCRLQLTANMRDYQLYGTEIAGSTLHDLIMTAELELGTYRNPTTDRMSEKDTRPICRTDKVGRRMISSPSSAASTLIVRA